MTRSELIANDYFMEQEMALILGISVKTLRNRHCASKDHPPRTPERLYPKKEFHEWNKKRLQRQENKAS